MIEWEKIKEKKRIAIQENNAVRVLDGGSLEY
jgi:hypothetical protein